MIILKEAIYQQKNVSNNMPDPKYLNSLRYSLGLSEKPKINKQLSFSRLFPKIAISLAVVGIIILMLPSINSTKKWTLAEAMEEIQKQIEYYSRTDIIIHRKNILTWYQDNQESWSVSYELYEDMGSSRFRNIAIYNQTNENNITYQVKDGLIFWDYSSRENTLRKEQYFDDPSGPQMKRVELLDDFENIVSADGTPISLMESTFNGQKAIMLTRDYDSNVNNEIKYFREELYFDQTSFKLIGRKDYDKVNDVYILRSIDVEEVYEAIERTPENLTKYFVFDFKLPNKVQIVEINLQPTIVPTTEISPMPTFEVPMTPISTQVELIKEDTVSFILNKDRCYLTFQISDPTFTTNLRSVSLPLGIDLNTENQCNTKYFVSPNADYIAYLDQIQTNSGGQVVKAYTPKWNDAYIVKYSMKSNLIDLKILPDNRLLVLSQLENTGNFPTIDIYKLNRFVFEIWPESIVENGYKYLQIANEELVLLNTTINKTLNNAKMNLYYPVIEVYDFDEERILWQTELPSY